MLLKFSEIPLNHHCNINIGNVFEFRLKFPKMLVEVFNYFIQNFVKLRENLLIFSQDFFKFL